MEISSLWITTWNLSLTANLLCGLLTQNPLLELTRCYQGTERGACTITISLTCDVLLIPIDSILNYFLYYIYWPVHVPSSLPGFTWSKIFQVSSYMSNMWPAVQYQGCQKHQAFIYSKVYHWVFAALFYGLDGPVILRKNKQNIKKLHYIRRSFVIFTLLVNKKFVSFLPTSLQSFVFYLSISSVSSLQSQKGQGCLS